jgi:hypothetical protein
MANREQLKLQNGACAQAVAEREQERDEDTTHRRKRIDGWAELQWLESVPHFQDAQPIGST